MPIGSAVAGGDELGEHRALRGLLGQRAEFAGRRSRMPLMFTVSRYGCMRRASCAKVRYVLVAVVKVVNQADVIDAQFAKNLEHSDLIVRLAPPAAVVIESDAAVAFRRGTGDGSQDLRGTLRRALSSAHAVHELRC